MRTAATLSLTLALAALHPPMAWAGTRTLDLWVNHTEAEALQFEQLVKGFRAAHPRIAVNVVNAQQDYYQRLITGLASGNGPDVFYVRPGTDRFLFKSGLARSLDPLVRRDIREVDPNDFFDGLRQELMYEGVWWALPYDYSVIGLYYNQDMFGQAGVTYPDETWTWDDLKTAATKLTRTGPGGSVTQWGMLNLNWYLSQWFEGFALTHGGHVFNRDYTRSVANNPAIIEALRVPHSLIHELHVAPYPAQVNVTTGFAEQLGAMTLGGSWETAELRTSANFNFEVAILPQSAAGRRVVSATGGAWAMSSFTEEVEEAWQLIKFLTSPAATQVLIVEPNRSLPPRKSLMRAWAERLALTGQAPRDAYTLADQAMRFGRHVPLLDFDARQIFDKHRVALYAGQRSPAEAAQWIEHDLNEEFQRVRGT